MHKLCKGIAENFIQEIDLHCLKWYENLMLKHTFTYETLNLLTIRITTKIHPEMRVKGHFSDGPKLVVSQDWACIGTSVVIGFPGIPLAPTAWREWYDTSVFPAPFRFWIKSSEMTNALKMGNPFKISYQNQGRAWLVHATTGCSDNCWCYMIICQCTRITWRKFR